MRLHEMFFSFLVIIVLLVCHGDGMLINIQKAVRPLMGVYLIMKQSGILL